MAPAGESAHDIGNKTFRRPITAADDVAGAYGRDTDMTGSEKRLAISVDDKLGTRLAHAIWLTATEPIVFPKLPVQFQVLIDLVGRDDDNAAHAIDLAHSLQQLDRPHDIDIESLHRLAEGLADQAAAPRDEK